MELIPKALVVGGFMPPAMPGATQTSVEKLNRIWAEVAGPYGFTQLQMSPDRTAATFVGATPEDGVSIQPPLLQVQRSIKTTPDQEAEQVQDIYKVVARHLGVPQFFNLGIRHVYNAPAPNNEGRDFVLRRVMGAQDDALGELGTENLWVGVTINVVEPDRTYVLKVEPLQADEMKSLFIDLDAQFPGPFEADSITGRAREAQQYVTGAVDRYLDRLAELS